MPPCVISLMVHYVLLCAVLKSIKSMLLGPPSALVFNLLKWKQLLKISTKSHRGSHLLHLAVNVDF